jgi:hypothetical protein
MLWFEVVASGACNTEVSAAGPAILITLSGGFALRRAARVTKENEPCQLPVDFSPCEIELHL